MDNQFSLSQAKKAFQNGNLHNWVQEYLLKEGSNKKLAEHLQNTTVKHIELCEYSLSDLRQVMGLEQGMLFSEPHNKWESRINNLLISLNNNAIFPPLITTDIWADLHLSDGSHRHEALLRFGLNKYWPIFYITKIETYNLIVLKKNEK